MCNSPEQGVINLYQFVFPSHETRALINRPHLVYFANSSVRPFFVPRLMHKHSERLEIIYVAQGKGTYIISGFTYSVKKGDLLIINSEQIHDEIADPQTGLNIYCCGVQGVRISGLKPNQLLPNDIVPVIHLGEYESYISNIFLCMQQFVLKERDASADLCDALLSALIELIHQLYIPRKVPASDNDQFGSVQRVKLYIDNNFSNDITMECIAESLNMSVSYMAHSFRKLVGCSPGQYIIQRRIGEAQTLLSLTDSSITQISASVGYDNSNYFSTLFKKMTQLSPKQYRCFCTAESKGWAE